MELFLIRHGETQANLDPSKPPILTENGKKQVKLLAESLKEENIDLIISSDLERAQLTAEELNLKNISKPKFEITQELREIYRLIVGGEPKEGTRPNRFEEDLQRANNFWDKLVRLDLKKVVVVSHGNIMKFFISKVLEIDPKNTKNIVLDPTSINVVKIKDDKIELKCLNNMNHISNKYEKETIYAD